LNPFKSLTARRRNASNAAKLYGSIMAQARLPHFYQSFGVPDTLEGRFVVLSLNLFAVLYRLKEEGAAALDLAQDLTDRFGADMETVLREAGIGDLAIPKKMRRLTAESAALLQDYEKALAAGDAALAATIGTALKVPEPEATSARLAHYLKETLRRLEAQDLAALSAGEVRFPGPKPGEGFGDETDEA
jgi:cytochrome b pre-mRNA-processing protein 3